MTIFVLDNSVTMRWFFDDGNHPYADAMLFDLMSPTGEAVVPVLWRYEVSAVLARACSKGAIPAKDAMDFIDDLQALPILVDDESEKHIFRDVHRLAIIYKLTSYDAAYLELALRRNLPLATLDDELKIAAVNAGVIVL
ncbi:MAG: type II toxin-antitoxin system VapC family toxin [Beijerinckiaceae bacterium]|nr:type II toxin-antitoxin system VapC family toxin [Beijerinckiaceae bacterium]